MIGFLLAGARSYSVVAWQSNHKGLACRWLVQPAGACPFFSISISTVQHQSLLLLLLLLRAGGALLLGIQHALHTTGQDVLIAAASRWPGAYVATGILACRCAYA